MQQPEYITPGTLHAWRMAVGWTMERTAGELGYGSAASVVRWENGKLPIPHTVQVALRWLIHVTPENPAKIAPPMRKMASSRRPWLASELAQLMAMDTTPPGSMMEMALKLGRSHKAVVTAVVKLRNDGLMPRDSLWRRRKRGPKNKRIAVASVPTPRFAPPALPSIMGDSFKNLAVPKPEEWRSAIQGPRR